MFIASLVEVSSLYPPVGCGGGRGRWASRAELRFDYFFFPTSGHEGFTKVIWEEIKIGK